MKLKFLTLNIYNGNFLAECLPFLKQENPDVFVLQEVYRGGNSQQDQKYSSYEILKDSFKDYHSFYSAEYFIWRNKRKIDSGKAIFSRFPLLNRDAVFFAGEYRERKAENAEEFLTCGRSLQSASLQIEGKELHIFNIHGIWGFDGKDNPARLKMSEVTVKQLNNKQQVILAGDFNLTPDTQTIKNIEKYLTNIFAGSLTSTFNLKMKEEGIRSGLYSWKAKDLKGFAVSVVDMIFVSPNLKIVDRHQPEVDVSDHYPLITTVEL